MTSFCYRPCCFSYVNDHVHGLLALEYHDLHMTSRKVCNKTRSPPASLLFKGQGTEHTTVKWPNVDQMWTMFADKLAIRLTSIVALWIETDL